jgi:hypothetical protein
MKKIFIRSPYFIEVNEVGQTSAKIEVFLWNKDTTVPTTPNYTFTKQVPSPTQTKLSWNVSNLAQGFIKPIAPVSVSVPTEENVNTWCYMRVISYSDDVELLDEVYVCLNGYTSYSGGYNQFTDADVVPLFNTSIKSYVKDFDTNYVNIFFEVGTYDTSYDFLNITEDSLWKYPILQSSEYVDSDLGVYNFYAEELCEPIYTPVVCTYINRYGGWQYLTFFKANQQGIDVKSKDYNLLPSSIDFNPLQGIKQRFNFQGTQKIKCNTGWVDENYSELIQDLMLSKVVLLDNKPAIVKSQSFDIKTHLKDKNINYEIEFEFNYGLINDVI